MSAVLLTCHAETVYLYYPIWPRSSPRRKATSSTTTSSRAPASTANPASSTRSTSALPRKSRPWSKTVPPRSRFPLHCGTSECLALSGWPPGKTGLFALLESLWPAPRSGPSPAHYLLLAAIHRVCQPGPKTEVADWYRSTILDSAWGFPSERFRSQDFWDAFEQILPERLDPLSSSEDPLDQAQLLLLGLCE